MEYNDKKEGFVAKLKHQCAAQEKCSYDISLQLNKAGFTNAEQQEILDELLLDKFIDNQRYADAFVRDKLKFNRWGKQKLYAMLKNKHLANEIIRAALEKIDPDFYMDILKSELRKKLSNKSLDKVQFQKLYRFALSKGFENGFIITAFKEMQKESD